MVSGLIAGVVGLVITVIIAFVVIGLLNGSNLLTANSAEQNATDRLVSNFTDGIDEVSSKIPTILLIAAVVILLGVIVVLVVQARRTGMFGGGSL